MINIKGDQRSTDLLGERFGNSLVVSCALGKEIFAHQLNQGDGHGGERHHDDQKVGKYDSPAYGVQIDFNPCQ